MLAHLHHTFLISGIGLIWRMQIKAAFHFKQWVLLKSCFLVWAKTSQLESLKCRNSVTQSEKDSKRIAVIWRKPSAILSSPPSSPSLCQLHIPFSMLPLSSCWFSHNLDNLFFAYKLHLSPPTSFSFPNNPSLCLLAPSFKVTLPQISPFYAFLLITIPFPTSLFSFPVTSSLCYMNHLCSLNQYSDPFSNHPLHHLTHLPTGLEPSVFFFSL